jgi:hypothetical protein
MHAPLSGGSVAISRRKTLRRLDVVVDSNTDERFDNTLNASPATTALRRVQRECGTLIATDLWSVNRRFEKRLN